MGDIHNELTGEKNMLPLHSFKQMSTGTTWRTGRIVPL